MTRGRLAIFGQTMLRLFPERQILVESGQGVRLLILTPALQMCLAGGVFLLALWTLLSTLGAIVSLPGQGAAVAKTRGYYERLLAERDAKLNSAVSRLSHSSGALLADTVEKRHAALAMLFTQFSATAGQAGVPALRPATPLSPVDPIQAVQQDQERLIDSAESAARSRAERLRLAFRLAGLNPASVAAPGVEATGVGGPLIEAKDPRALAAVLEVDEGFARRIQSVAKDLTDARSLSATAEMLPLKTPVLNPVKSSGYGVRNDPFTGGRAFHPGQDFSGRLMQPVLTTGPGIVSFTGQRTGYGNTIEIDHGHGFKTRYGHLAAIGVKVGQPVGVGQRIGSMGSTGRSTGVHLHYEVWENGKLQDPSRFLKAGQYIAEAG